MKKIILIILAVVFLIFLAFGLCIFLLIKESEYSSKEETEYYENLCKNSVFFEPLDTAFILEFQSEYFEIQESELNYEPYSPDKYRTPYADSIYLLEIEVYSHVDDIQEIKIEKIGKINKTQILKYEKKDSVEAFIYKSYEFDDTGIGIGYSENNGKDWNYYYTGITQKQPVFVKFYSQRPLIKEKGKLEIDACLLRQLSPSVHPLPGPTYECVKDGIYLVFDIDVIAKDSDGDGLTDIVEDKLHTDKFNIDTDGDGIPDNLDANPRVHYPRTKMSKVYEIFLNEEIGDKDMDWAIGRIIIKGNNTIYYMTDSVETVIFIPDDKSFMGIQRKKRISFMTPTQTVLIVTDDKDLMGVQPKNKRVIFLTTEEYKNKAKAFDSELNQMYFTPFFKVDGKRNTYVVTRDIDTGSRNYLVQKMIIGWRIRLLSTIIS